MVNAAIPVLAVLIAVLFIVGEPTLQKCLCARLLSFGVNPLISWHNQVAMHAEF